MIGALNMKIVMANKASECLKPADAEPSTIFPATIPPNSDSKTPAKKKTDSKYVTEIFLRLRLKPLPASEKVELAAGVGRLFKGAMNWDVIIIAMTRKIKTEM